MEPHFVLFGTAHLIAIALAFGAPVLMALLARATGSQGLAIAFRWSLAGLLIATYALWYALIWQRGWADWGNTLPMHLCDWAAIACIFALFAPNQRTYELAYFWGLSATLQATLTPELALGWPDLRFIVFFGFHCGVIAAVLFMTLGLRMRPYPSSLPRVVVWTLVYGAAAGLVDWLTGANYGFLREKSRDPSVLDYLAPWPWYIAELGAIALVFILILYAPFTVADRLRRRP